MANKKQCLKWILLAVMIVASANVFATTPDLEQRFNFDGYLLDSGGTPKVGPVSVTFKIYNPAEDCLLYEENHTGVALNVNGGFSLKVGAGSRVTSSDGGQPLKTIFQNAGLVRSSGVNCAGYTPANGDGRKLRVIVDGTPLNPAYDLSPVPFATVAETLQGKPLDLFSLKTDFSTCSAGQAVTYDGSTFSCVGVNTSSGITSITSGYPQLGFSTSAGVASVLLSVGTTSGTLAAGNDSRIVGALQGTNNLTDLASIPAARANLGLGSIVTFSASDVILSLDSRLSDSRNPIGPAGGELSGAYPNPLVGSVGGWSASSIGFAVSSVINAQTNSVASTLVQRDVNGKTALNGIYLFGTMGDRVLIRPHLSSFTDYDFILPTTPGSYEEALISSGGGSPMTWQTVVLQGGNNNAAPLILGTNMSDDVIIRTNFTDRLTVTGSGLVGINTMFPTESLHVVGNVRVQGSTSCVLGTGSGSTMCSSDSRLKENVQVIPDALRKIEDLRGVSFDWNYLSRAPGQHAMGVIAQDVKKVFPTAVARDSDGFLMVDYAVLVAPLIEATKELSKQNKDLKSELTKRDQVLADLAARLSRLEEKK